MSRTVHSVERTKHHPVAWISQAIGLMGLWWIYVGKSSRDEWAVGVAAMLLSMVGARVVTMQEPFHVRPRATWILMAAQLPALIVEGCAVLVKRFYQQLARKRPPKGVLLAVHFNAGGDSERDVARRALSIFYTTMPPNFVIIDIDRKTNLMVFHQVEKGPVPEITKALGAS